MGKEGTIICVEEQRKQETSMQQIARNWSLSLDYA
jgi:hypothetical protein